MLNVIALDLKTGAVYVDLTDNGLSPFSWTKINCYAFDISIK